MCCPHGASQDRATAKTGIDNKDTGDANGDTYVLLGVSAVPIYATSPYSLRVEGMGETVKKKVKS